MVTRLKSNSWGMDIKKVSFCLICIFLLSLMFISITAVDSGVEWASIPVRVNIQVDLEDEDDYKKSWEHSQEAIKLANTPCPPNCVGKCGGASDGCGGSCNAACPADQVCTNGSCTPKPKEEKPLIVQIVEVIINVIVTIVKAIVNFFRRLFRW